MVIVDFSMFPMGESASVSDKVARSLDIIDQSGLDYRLHAMGTSIEGELDEVLDVLRKCFAAMGADSERISCTAKFDYRKGTSGRLSAKVKRVEEVLGRELKKA